MNLNDNPRAGGFCITNPAVIVVSGGSKDLEITPTNMLYVIDGLHYTVASGDADVPLNTTTANTIAAGYSRLYLACVIAAGTVSVVVGDSIKNTDITAGKAIQWPIPTEDSIPFCGILVTNSTASIFTAGTTDLATTSIFCDIHDLFTIPAAPLVALATTQQT